MDSTYEKLIEVRLDDIDLNGHLHNSRYLEYANHARASYFEESDFPVSRMYKDGFGPVMFSEVAEYRHERRVSPAQVPGWTSRPGRSRPRHRKLGR